MMNNDLFSGPFQAQQQSTSTPAPQPTRSGPGFLSKLVSGLTSAPKFFLKTDVENPIKEVTAQLTGNQKAYNNAEKDQFKGAKNAGQAVKQVTGNAVQLAAETLAPEGESLFGKIGAGAVGGGAFGGGAALANNESLGNIAKQTGLGAITGAIAQPVIGGILGKVLGKGGTAAADTAEDLGNDTRNVFQKTADSLDRSVINPKESPSPFAAGKAQDLVDYLKNNGIYKPGDNAQQVYEKLEPHFNQLQSKIGEVLKNDTSTVNGQGATKLINDAIDSNNHFLGSNAAAEQVRSAVAEAVSKLQDENGNLGAKDLYNLKNQMQDELSGAYNKIEKGASPTGGEDALLQARNAVNKLLPDEAKQLGKDESMLYDAAPGLAKNASEKLRIKSPSPFGILPSTRVPSQAGSNLFQTIKSGAAGAADLIGNAGEKVASATNNVVGNGIRTVASRAVVPAAVSATAPQPGSQPVASVTPQPQPANAFPEATSFNPAGQSPQATNSFGIAPQDIAQAMTKALAAGDTKAFSSLNTLYGLVNAEQKAQQPSASLVTKGASANSASNALDSLSKAYSSTDLAGKGILSSLTSHSPIGGGSLKAINDSIPQVAAEVGKATGISATAILPLLPKVSDSPQVAQTKIAELQNEIAQYLQDQQNSSQPSDALSLAGISQ